MLLRPFMLITVVSLCVTIPACSLTNNPSRVVAEHRLDPPSASLDQVRALLSRLSITPETACAAGVSPNQVPTLLQAGADALETLGPSLQAHELAVRSARSYLAALRRRAADQLDTGLEPIIQQAEATLASNLEAQALLSQTAFETVIAPLSQEQKTLLTTLRSNARRSVPTEYKAISRTSEQWNDLQQALLHVRSRQACGMAPLSEKLAVVTGASADATVSVARQRLEANLASFRGAWSVEELP